MTSSTNVYRLLDTLSTPMLPIDDWLMWEVPRHTLQAAFFDICPNVQAMNNIDKRRTT